MGWLRGDQAWHGMAHECSGCGLEHLVGCCQTALRLPVQKHTCSATQCSCQPMLLLPYHADAAAGGGGGKSFEPDPYDGHLNHQELTKTLLDLSALYREAGRIGVSRVLGWGGGLLGARGWRGWLEVVIVWVEEVK